MSQSLTDTVWTFLDRASDLYGDVKAQHFAQDMAGLFIGTGFRDYDKTDPLGLGDGEG